MRIVRIIISATSDLLFKSHGFDLLPITDNNTGLHRPWLNGYPAKAKVAMMGQYVPVSASLFSNRVFRTGYISACRHVG